MSAALGRDRFVPRAGAVRLIFLLAAVAATSPAWRPALFGTNPALDDLLRLRCPVPGQASLGQASPGQPSAE